MGDGGEYFFDFFPVMMLSHFPPWVIGGGGGGGGGGPRLQILVEKVGDCVNSAHNNFERGKKGKTKSCQKNVSYLLNLLAKRPPRVRFDLQV